MISSLKRDSPLLSFPCLLACSPCHHVEILLNVIALLTSPPVLDRFLLHTVEQMLII